MRTGVAMKMRRRKVWSGGQLSVAEYRRTTGAIQSASSSRQSVGRHEKFKLLNDGGRFVLSESAAWKRRWRSSTRQATGRRVSHRSQGEAVEGRRGQGGVQGRESGECRPDFQHQSRAPTEPRTNSAFTEKPFVNFLAASFSGKLMGDND